MLIKLHSIIVILILLSGSFLEAQDGEFEYNPLIARDFGLAALKETFSKNNDKSFEKEFNIDKYKTYGRLIMDCEGSTQRIIMVAYPSKKENGCAMVLMAYSYDRTTGSVFHREKTIETANGLIDSFKEGNWTEEVFHCGL